MLNTLLLYYFIYLTYLIYESILMVELFYSLPNLKQLSCYLFIPLILDYDTIILKELYLYQTNIMLQYNHNYL